MSNRKSSVRNLSSESSFGKDLGTQATLSKSRSNESIIYNETNVKEKISWGLLSTNNYDRDNIGYDKFYPETIDITKDEILDFYIKIEREDDETGELVPFAGEDQTIKRKYFLLSAMYESIINSESGGSCDCDGYSLLDHRHNRLYDEDLSHITLSTITEFGNLIHNPSPHDILSMNNDDEFYTGVKNSFVMGSKNYSITQGTVNADGETPNDLTYFASILSSRSTGIFDSSFAMILASEGEDLIAPPIIDTETGGDSDGIVGDIEFIGTEVNISPDNIIDNDLFIVPIQKYIEPTQLELSPVETSYPTYGNAGAGEGLVLYLKGDVSGLLTGETLLTVETVNRDDCSYKENNLKKNNAGQWYRVEIDGTETYTIVFCAEGFRTFDNTEVVDVTTTSTNINTINLPKIALTTTNSTIAVGETIELMGICWGGSQTLQIFGDGQNVAGLSNYAMTGASNNHRLYTASTNGSSFFWTVDTVEACPNYSTNSNGGSTTTPSLQVGSKYVVALASYHSKLLGAKYSVVSGLKNTIYGNEELPRVLFGKYAQLGSSTNTLFGIGNGEDLTNITNITNQTDDFNLVLSVGFDETESYVDFHGHTMRNVKAGVNETDGVNVSQLIDILSRLDILEGA